MIPSSFEMLSNKCLPEIWHSYPAWPGAIAMMAASLIFFIEYIAITSTQNNGHETKEALPMHKNELDSPVTNSDEDTTHHSHHCHTHGTLALLTKKSQTIGIIILELGICLH